MAERGFALPPELVRKRVTPVSSNRLLASLSPDDFSLLEPHLKSVTLGLRKYLEDQTGELKPSISPTRASHPWSPFNPMASKSKSV